jgi:hypothetical protein
MQLAFRNGSPEVKVWVSVAGFPKNTIQAFVSAPPMGTERPSRFCQ